MKVLHLISSAGFFGAENALLQLSRQLKKTDLDNVLGIFENSHNPHVELARKAEEEGLRAEIFHCDGRLDVKALRRIRRFVLGSGVDIIHTHGYKSNLYGFMAAKLSGKPVVCTCHNWVSDDLKTRAYYRLDKSILRWFDRIVAVSEDIRDELLQSGVRADRLHLIYNGIDTGKGGGNGALRGEFNIAAGKRIVGTVARFTPEKGLHNLLRAAGKISGSFPDAVFMFVGDGPLREGLERECAELGLKDMAIFTGLRTDMPEVYSAMDVFVLPSLKEGLPMALLEAMAAGKPVIATDVGAVGKVVEDGKDGILIDPGDVGDLEKAVALLLTDTELSGRLSRNACEKVSQKFSSKAMCDRYLEVYGDMLRN